VSSLLQIASKIKDIKLALKISINIQSHKESININSIEKIIKLIPQEEAQFKVIQVQCQCQAGHL
jgi:hypothetical protein